MRIEPPSFLADPGLQTILACLPSARPVGGCVRDALLGGTVADIDLATPLPPQQVRETLQAAGLRVIPTGLSHGTLTALAGGTGYEITTLRTDVETDGRHAVVAFTDDWREDAARRDFTINAMSLRPPGDVFDYFDGLADLRAGRVRFVGDPATRIAEDRLRVLRFFRFQGRYGRAPADAAALAAIAAAAADLPSLSAERIWSELKRILIIPDPSDVVELMARLGVLSAVLPGRARADRLRALIRAGAPGDVLLRLAALVDADPLDAAARLRLSNEETATLVGLRDRALPKPGDAPGAWLADTPKPILLGRLWLAGADPALIARYAAHPTPRFPLEGRDVVALGLAPGPAVGEALRAVRSWWLANGATADRDACLARLQELPALHRPLPM